MAEENGGGLTNGEMTDSGLFDCMESEEIPPDLNQENIQGQDGEATPDEQSQAIASPEHRQVLDNEPENQAVGVMQGESTEGNVKDETHAEDDAKDVSTPGEPSLGQRSENPVPQEEQPDTESSQGEQVSQAVEGGEPAENVAMETAAVAQPPPLDERMPADGEGEQETVTVDTGNAETSLADTSTDQRRQTGEDETVSSEVGKEDKSEAGTDRKVDSVPQLQVSSDDTREQDSTPEMESRNQEDKTHTNVTGDQDHDTRTQTEADSIRPSPEREQEGGRKSSHSSKSVKFLDETPSQGDVGEDEDEDRQVAIYEKYAAEERQQESDDDTDRSEESPENKSEGKSSDLFQTAVSEEKIEEAKQRRTSVIDKEAFAVDLFGSSEVEKETMSGVIDKKAREHFERGRQLMEESDFYKAITSLDKALNLKPKNIEFFIQRGECYLQICDFQSAILNYKKACVLDPENEDYYNRLAFIYFFQGQTLFDQHKFSDALESFSRAAEMKPEIVGYHTRSVACLAALQRHGECLALVNKRLEVEQENSDLYIMRARLHELFRNTTLCFYDLKDALQLNPDQAEAKMMMKQLEDKANDYKAQTVQMNLAGKYKEALQKISMAIETNPTIAEYHVVRGALHRRLQDFNSAIDDYLLALDKTDHDEEHLTYQDSQRQLLLTYNDFAVECFTKGFFDEAIILLNKAIKGEKREKGLYVNRGDCFFKQDELQFALADYHQALELDQQDWSIRARIANIHNEFGLLDYDDRNYQEAEARFTIAIKHNPRVAQYYVSRSKVRFMMENHGGARQDLLLALHLDPSNDELMSLLPRLFPGKAVGDVMRSKAARAAKLAIENAVVMASPVKLPTLAESENGSETVDRAESEKSEEEPMPKPFSLPGTAYSYKTTYKPGFPDLKACLDEMEFHKHILKGKKKITTKVKKMLHDRNSLKVDVPKLAPQPPARPVAIRGGALGSKGMVSVVNPKEKSRQAAGWRTYSLGISPT